MRTRSDDGREWYANDFRLGVDVLALNLRMRPSQTERTNETDFGDSLRPKHIMSGLLRQACANYAAIGHGEGRTALWPNVDDCPNKNTSHVACMVLSGESLPRTFTDITCKAQELDIVKSGI